MFLWLALVTLSGFASAKYFTVSGLGSGGYMAGQMHIAHSKSVIGAGIIGAGPYYCSFGSAVTADTVCRKHGFLIKLEALEQYVDEMQKAGKIDPISSLQHSKVYIFGGREDSVVYPDVTYMTDQFYKHYLDVGLIKTDFDVIAEHAWVTDFEGNPCDHLASPFINYCGVDLAGEMFYTFYPNAERKDQNNTSIKSFTQSLFGDITSAGLAPYGYAYIPEQCTDSCPVHVAFHDCEQDYDSVQDRFVKNTGLNMWAEGSNVIVVYPQIQKQNEKNRLGCWDFWGYTGENFALKGGPQVQIVYNITQNIEVLIKNAH